MSGSSTPYRPAPPRPTRLNHVALLAFAGLIVASAVVALLSVRAPSRAEVAPRVVAAQGPRFPDAPVVDPPHSLTRVRASPSPAAASPAFRSPLVLHAAPRDTATPPARYVLESGAIIPAVLITEVRSTLPGLVLAQVERDVYDTPTARAVLIPRGSRLVGHYDSQVAQGEDALRVVWTRLTFPDGRWLSLPDFESADAGGTSGLRGSVDAHLARAYVNAGVMSVVGAGAQLSQAPASVPYGVASPGQVLAGSVGQQVTEESMDLLRTNSHVAPTITVRGGTSFLVMVSRDLGFDGPYAR